MKLSVILCLIVLVSCSADPNEIPESTNLPQPIVFNITADVNGTTVENLASSNLESYRASMSYNTKTDMNNNCINRSYTPTLVSVNGDLPEFQIGFINLLDEMTMTCDDELTYFETFLETQEYTYADNALGEGVSIKYQASSTDPVYTNYNTQPTPPQFEITNIEVVDCSPKKCIDISGTFEATVFNASNPSETLTLTNGAFKVRMQSQN